MTTQQEKVYLKLHKSFVKEDLLNKETGKTFNMVTLPKGTMIDGKDVGGFSFSPFFVNTPNLFKDNELQRDEEGKPLPNLDSPMREIPCMKDKELWLKKDDETIKVLPEKVKEALKQNRTQYLANKKEQKQEVAQDTPEQEAPAQDKPAQDAPKQDKPKKRPSPAELAKKATARAKAANAERKEPAQDAPKQAPKL